MTTNPRSPSSEPLTAEEELKDDSRERRSGSVSNGGRPLVAMPPLPTQHRTDGATCWCQPTAERQPDGSYVFVHRNVST